MTLGIILKAPYGTISMADRRLLVFSGKTIASSDQQRKVFNLKGNGRNYIGVGAGSATPLVSSDGSVNVNLSQVLLEVGQEVSKLENATICNAATNFQNLLKTRLGLAGNQSLCMNQEKLRGALELNIYQHFGIELDKVKIHDDGHALYAEFQDKSGESQKLCVYLQGIRFVIAGYDEKGTFEVGGTSIPGPEGMVAVNLQKCKSSQFSFTTVGQDDLAKEKMLGTNWGNLDDTQATNQLCRIIYETSVKLEKSGELPSVSKSSFGMMVKPGINKVFSCENKYV